MLIRLQGNLIEFEGEPLWHWHGSDGKGRQCLVELYGLSPVGFAVALCFPRKDGPFSRSVFVCQGLGEVDEILMQIPDARWAFVDEGGHVREWAERRYIEHARACARDLERRGLVQEAEGGQNEMA